MDRYLSPNFKLSEFEAASHRLLTIADELRAQWWAQSVLQPARDILGPIRIPAGGYIRSSGTGAHQAGDGIDLVPLQVSVRTLADWFAGNKLGPGRPLVQVIDERDHVHLARSLVPGATPGYLAEPVEGKYVMAPAPGKIVGGLLLVVGLFAAAKLMD